MPEDIRFRLHLTGPARRDIAAIDSYTMRTFGEPAADRYAMLIRRALQDTQDDPSRPGVKGRPGALNPEICLYHLSSSREHVSGLPVKEPRRFIAFRQKTKVIEILRVLHDSRDLARHLPAE